MFMFCFLLPVELEGEYGLADLVEELRVAAKQRRFKGDGLVL